MIYAIFQRTFSGLFYPFYMRVFNQKNNLTNRLLRLFGVDSILKLYKSYELKTPETFDSGHSIKDFRIKLRQYLPLLQLLPFLLFCF